MSDSEITRSPGLSRRTVVVGGAAAVGALGAVAVAGCAGGPPAEAPAAPAAAPATGTTLGPAADVPVGSAKIFADQKVVVTQATAGTFAGFSVVCPHQGCAVTQVEGAAIICPCHGSEFGLDGSVKKGPAKTGLAATAVTVKGADVTIA